MYTCKNAVDLLLQYVDGDMPPEERTALEAHFSGCTPCEEFLASYKATSSLCKKSLAVKMPQNVADSLTSFLRKNCTPKT